jgi:hypothetical protein
MLSHSDFRNVNQHIDAYIDHIEGLGLRLRVDDDLTAFACARAEFKGYVHPALDPNRSDVRAGLWLEATGPDRRIAGCVAIRRFDNECLSNLIWSRQLWGDRRPLLRSITPITLTWPDDMPSPMGRLIYSGGLFLDERYRSAKVGISMVRLLRALAFRDWRPDWVFGLAAERLALADIPRKLYGYTRTVPCFNEKTDFGPVHQKEWLSLISLDEMKAEYLAPATLPSNWEPPILNEGNRNQLVATG